MELPALRKREICVIGNLNVDLLIRGMTSLPEWGREVVGTSHHAFPSGQAGYLALGLAALEVPVSVVGVVGDDEAGTGIVRALADAHVDATGISKLKGEQTGLTVALVRPDGERAFVSNIGCSGSFSPELVQRSAHVIARAGLVAVVGLFMIPNLPITRVRELFAQCRRRGQQTMLDTGWDPKDWGSQTLDDVKALLSEVDLFLPNLDEAQAITGEHDPDAALRALSSLCAGSVVIKCGSEGSIARHDDAILRHPAYAVTVIDAVGAGDSFDAGLLAALADGGTMDGAIRRAHAFAALYVSRESNRYACRAEVDTFLADRHRSFVESE